MTLKKPVLLRLSSSLIKVICNYSPTLPQERATKLVYKQISQIGASDGIGMADLFSYNIDQ